MQLQQLGFPAYGYSPSSSNAGPGSAGSGATAANAGNIAGSSALSADAAALSTALTGSASEFTDVRESETLDIQMKDGTEVTLRLRAHESTLATSQSQADGSTSSAAALLASGQMQVEVSGNPSSADLDAINSVVSQVNALANQFFSGDVQDAFAAAASLNIDSSHIAALGLQLTYSGTLVQQATANADADTVAGTSSAAASPSPQQIIVSFVRQAMTKLARGNTATDQVSSRWKVKLLAQALPAYARAAQAASQASATAAAQGTPAASAAASAAAGPTSPGAATTATSPPSSGAAASPATAAAPGTPAAQTATAAQTTPTSQPAAGGQSAAKATATLQAARLAADTLIRSAQ